MFYRIINILLLVILCFFTNAQTLGGPFKNSQIKHERVKKAYESKYAQLKKELKAAGFENTSYELFIRVFKFEKVLQVWLRPKGDLKFKHFKDYAICANSGDLGPKRQEGDGQVPEGFYEIQSFNPFSSYHLSLKVNYPNKSDLIKKNGKPGGDIMIHGECVTIGCIPLQNDPIEELYVLCVESKDKNFKINVDIFPCKFTEENIKMLNKNYSKEKNKFWDTLKEAYLYFEKNFVIPKIAIDKAGNYNVIK